MDVDLEGCLRTYLDERGPLARYASFDYCFNYFQEHRERDSLSSLAEGATLQTACLQLGFYLASWGMLRGSSTLLQQSLRVFAPVIEAIADAPSEIWETDANDYGDGSCPLIFETCERIKGALPGTPSDTLVTKIMLGTIGCVPAFDTYFKEGFRASTFGRRALRRIGEFYQANSELIERYRVPTLDFTTGMSTGRRYTRAKVIDMIFFTAGGG